MKTLKINLSWSSRTLQNINEAIVLLGQVINKVTYERRLSILAGLNDVKQAKSLIKDNLEDLNTETKFLFGETFHVKATAKAQESAEKLFAKTGGKRKWSATNNRPNQQGLSPSQQGPRQPTGGASTRRGRGSWNNVFAHGTSLSEK